MVAPDYQEFTNRAKCDTRDNTVICGVGTSRTCGNQPSVAGLPRCRTSTKAELSACRRAWEALGCLELPVTISV